MNYLLVGKWVGGIVGGLAIAWAIYAGIIRPVTKPNPSTTQSGEIINNYNNTPRIGFGCARFEVRQDGKESKENTTITAPVSN